MKKRISTLFLLALTMSAYAQDKPGVGIGNPLPSQSAMLDITAPDKGVLIPRVALTDLTKYSPIVGGEEAGLLVYNNNEVKDANDKVIVAVGFYYWTKAVAPATAGKWELVTSQSIVDRLINRIEVIEKATGTGADGKDGGTVVYVPGEKGENGKDGTLGSIVIIDKDGNKKDVPTDELLLGFESETFFHVDEKDSTVPVDPNNPSAGFKKIKTLYYYSELAISNWKLEQIKKGTYVKGAKPSATDIGGITTAVEGVTKIDISSIVSSDFKKIVEDNSKTISEKINKLDGSISIVNDGDATNPNYKFVIQKLKDDGTPDTAQEIFFNAMETKTSFGKTVGNDTAAEVADAKVAPTADDLKKKGYIAYKYFGEEKDVNGDPIPHYINVTADMKTILETNTEIRNQITQVIKEVKPVEPDPNNPDPVDPTKPVDPKAYGNVYYGKVNSNMEPVLYSVDETGKIHYINISQNIINEITNNQDVIEKIKEVTTKVITEGEGVNTGEVIDGFYVKKGYATVTVNDAYGYDSAFQGTIPVSKFARLVKVSVLKGGVNGQLVVDSATEVVCNSGAGDAGTLKFSFGMGELYTPVLNGDYNVIFEYISTDAKQ